VRRRILRLAVITAVVTLVIFGLPLAAVVRIVALDDERAELTRAAERAAATVSADSVNGTDPVELPPADPDLIVGVYNAAGRLAAGTGPAGAEPTLTRALTGVLAEETGRGGMLVAVPVREDEHVLGLVRVRTSTAEVDRRTWLAWAVMLGLGLLALAAAALLARRQAGRLASPLIRLSDTAHALGDGDFTARSGRSGIAEIDAAAAALDMTAERLQALLTRERAFSARASHQLRTPLTGLRLTLESALAQDAVDATDRLERIIDELLVIARADSADRRPLDIDALLDDVRAERIGALAGQGRALRVERDDDLPAVVASPIAIRQILAVLVDNAIEHGAGTVTIRARDVAAGLALDVTDAGPGPGGRSDGRAAGLGLPMARALAEAEDGRLVLTAAGSPTTFTLFINGAETRPTAERPSSDAAAHDRQADDQGQADGRMHPERAQAAAGVDTAAEKPGHGDQQHDRGDDPNVRAGRRALRSSRRAAPRWPGRRP
jgi:signal transduction histidine kinase